MCRSKHVEPSKNFGIINSITKLHLVGISTECGLSLCRNDLNGFREQRAEESTRLYVTENDVRMRENYLTKSSLISR